MRGLRPHYLRFDVEWNTGGFREPAGLRKRERAAQVISVLIQKFVTAPATLLYNHAVHWFTNPSAQGISFLN